MIRTPVNAKGMRQRLPGRLMPGATIGVVAPASPATPESRIDAGISWLEAHGYSVVEGESVRQRDGYLAGSDAARAADLMRMFADPAIDAIFCTRGGYGTMRILPLLDYRVIKRCPKILIGFSDITALSLGLYRRTGLVTFAGPMVAAELASTPLPRTEKALWAALRGSMRELVVKEKGVRCLVPGTAHGTLLGGNLSLVSALIGTRWEPKWDGAILFLEDVGEPVYRLDRMFCHLHLAGVLNRVHGIVLGRFTGIDASEQDRSLDTVVREYLVPLGMPVLMGFPFGHTPDKVTLPIGTAVELDAGAKRLTFPDPYLR